MTSESGSDRWRRLKAVFEGAYERDSLRSEAWLDTACAGDPALRRDVEALLLDSEREGPFDRLHARIVPDEPAAALDPVSPGHRELRRHGADRRRWNGHRIPRN
jgi:hypothetical protein